MAVFAIYLAPAGSRHAGERAMLEDRFSWGAALFPPLWAAWHGLWLTLLVIVAAIVALVLASGLIGEAAFWLYVLGSVFLGFEAAQLRAWTLRRRGWQFAGDVVAGGPHLADLEYLRRAGAGA